MPHSEEERVLFIVIFYGYFVHEVSLNVPISDIYYINHFIISQDFLCLESFFEKMGV